MANIIAIRPRDALNVPGNDPAASKAPTIVIPEIAFEPDISGVWSVGGTLEITSNPTNTAKTNTYISTNN
jgi:hypothetical protein